ncbi:MAG: ABC transporter ATP-binding protein [Pseudomonadota bacterium]
MATLAHNPGEPPCLAVEGVSKGFHAQGRWTPVLEGVSFQVRTGEVLAILGPSGCGKTTLLNIIAGFLPQDRGRVLRQGRPVTRPGPDRGVVFQEDALLPWLTVAENVGLGLGGGRDQVARMLALVGLADHGAYLPRAISGGMKQRVALARVLVRQPAVLLMDEPFAALDAQTRAQMHELLIGLQGRLGQTVVFVTHDPEEAVKLADRVLVMHTAPGRLRREITVDLPRPRATDAPECLALKRAILSSLAGPDSQV